MDRIFAFKIGSCKNDKIIDRFVDNSNIPGTSQRILNFATKYDEIDI